MPDRSPARLLGTHLTADLAGCSAQHPWMTACEPLKQACLQALHAAGLTVVGECFHGFSPVQPGQPAGVTGVVLLAESHLAIHTWPEQGLVTIDVFVCHVRQDNRARAQQVLAQLIEGLAPQAQQVQVIARNMPAARNT